MKKWTEVRTTFILLPTLFLPHISSTMIVTWGIPTDYSQCLPSIGDDWNQSVAACQRDEFCVASFLINNSCFICPYSSINKIDKSDSSNGYKVAFKIDFKAENCVPDAVNPPTFDNKNVRGIPFESDGFEKGYEIEFLNNQWMFVYYSVQGCQTSWIPFRRDKGMWEICYESQETYKKEAVDRCGRFGAALSGLETMEEFEYFQKSTTEGWINGKRRRKCNVENDQLLEECKGLKAFIFSDQYLSTMAGYHLLPTEPSGNKYECSYADSFALVVSKSGEYGVDDRCGFISTMPGYFCGRPVPE